MANIPRLAYDLIDALDAQERTPQFPNTKAAAVHLDDSQIRLGIWHAARRALVDELLAMREEDEDEATGHTSTGGAEPRGIFDTPVLDPSGEEHRGVASMYMATARSTDDEADGG